MVKSKKSPAVKAAVVAKHVTGSSNSQIARDLEISRPTVIRILSEAEIDTFVQQGRAGLYDLIPAAVKTYSGGVRANVDRAEDFLERVKVLPRKEESGSISFNNFIGLGTLPRTDANGQHRGPVLPQPETA